MSGEVSGRFDRARLEAKLGIPLGVLADSEVFVLGIRIERAERTDRADPPYHIETYEPSMALSIETDLQHNAKVYKSGTRRSGLDEFVTNTYTDAQIPGGLKPVSQVIGDWVVRIDPPIQA